MVLTWRSGEREKSVLEEGVYEKRREITRACLKLKKFWFSRMRKRVLSTKFYEQSFKI